MALFAIAIPVLPGKTDDARAFTNELSGSRHQDFKESRRALGVRERAYLQQTPMGDLVIVTLEGDAPNEAFTKFGEPKNAFTDWFVERVKDVHGVDLRNLPDMPLPILVADSEA